MKNKTLFTLALLALIGLFALPAATMAQVSPTNQVVLTTSTSTIAASSTATVTSQAFSPNSLTGFAVVPNFTVSGTANNTGNVTFNFTPSLDGTNWVTSAPLSYAVAATGTTAVVGYCTFAPNISGSAANNIPYWRLQSVVNANSGGAVTINSITISKSNR